MHSVYFDSPGWMMISFYGGFHIDYFAADTKLRRKYQDDSMAWDYFREYGELPLPLYMLLQILHLPRREIYMVRKCSYTFSHYLGTFLDDSNLQPWKMMLFVNHWLHNIC